MSFLGKFMGGSNTSSSNTTTAKKDPNAPQPTLLEKHLADATGPVRLDGSDKFYGFENYGSTCYCNSIIQCLYYSAPFRENVITFPSKQYLNSLNLPSSNGAPPLPRATSTSPYPNLTSPARKQNVPNPAAPGAPKPEENKDSPDNKKRLALAAGPVLDMTHDNSYQYGMEESLFSSLRDIFEAIINHSSRIGVVSPHRFLEILRRDNEMFRSAMHQDAHEFLNLLLNQVVDNVDAFVKQRPTLAPMQQMNGQASNHVQSSVALEPASGTVPLAGLDTRWVHDLFEGLLTSETRCLTCETTSQRDEAFLDLSVDLSPHTSVTSCLRKFSEEEMLCERNKFHCDNCGGLQEAEKRMKIKRLPRILALHLKRFKYTEDLQRLQKLFHRVVYPFHLRLFNTTDDAEDPDRLYELYAVVVHIGGGPYHGHYVSIIKTQDRGWLLFDDELVEPVDKNYVLNFFGGEPVPGVPDARQLACAYVLFYQETTLEAMLREQAAEGAPMAVRTSDAETVKDMASPLKTQNDGLTTVLTASAADSALSEHMDTLAHAQTAPSQVHSPVRPQASSPPLPQSPLTAQDSLGGTLHNNSTFPSPGANSSLNPDSLPTYVPPKSKKELKQEEKDRKAAEKLATKERDAKERDAKSREESARRVEARRKAEEEMKRAMEMTRQSTAEEAKRRNTSDGFEGGSETADSAARLHLNTKPLPPPPSSTVASETAAPVKESSLARLKNGSMSLRSRQRFFGRNNTSSTDREGSATPTAITTPALNDLPTSSTTSTTTSYTPSAPASTISNSNSTAAHSIASSSFYTSPTDSGPTTTTTPLATNLNGSLAPVPSSHHIDTTPRHLPDPPDPTQHSHTAHHVADGNQNGTRDSVSALPRFFTSSHHATPSSSSSNPPDTPKKSRFSLGRKRSSAAFF